MRVLFFGRLERMKSNAQEDSFAIERCNDGEIQQHDGDGVGERCVDGTEPRKTQVSVDPAVNGQASAANADLIEKGSDDR